MFAQPVPSRIQRVLPRRRRLSGHMSGRVLRGNALCDPLCGGSTCNLGCNPGLCGPGCGDECDSILCRDNHCNPQVCPAQAQCDGTCAGGNYCNPGCSTECDHDLCYGNWLCNPVCGGYPCALGCDPGPCGPGCNTECDSFICRDNHCNPQRCPEQARCDGVHRKSSQSIRRTDYRRAAGPTKATLAGAVSSTDRPCSTSFPLP